MWLHVSFTTALGESVVLNVEHPYNNKDYIKSWYSPCQIANRLIAHRGVVSDRCESSNQVEIFLGALLGYGACVVEIVAEGPIIIFEIMLPFTSGHAPMKLVVRKKSE